MTTLVPNLAPTPVRTQRAALEQEAYDEKNKLLNQAQFQELLDLQTDEEPDFVHEGAFYTLVPIRPRRRWWTPILEGLLPASLSAQGTSLSIPAIDAFQLHLTPFNSTPTSLRMERP